MSSLSEPAVAYRRQPPSFLSWRAASPQRHRISRHRQGRVRPARVGTFRAECCEAPDTWSVIAAGASRARLHSSGNVVTPPVSGKSPPPRRNRTAECRNLRQARDRRITVAPRATGRSTDAGPGGGQLSGRSCSDSRPSSRRGPRRRSSRIQSPRRCRR